MSEYPYEEYIIDENEDEDIDAEDEDEDVKDQEEQFEEKDDEIGGGIDFNLIKQTTSGTASIVGFGKYQLGMKTPSEVVKNELIILFTTNVFTISETRQNLIIKEFMDIRYIQYLNIKTLVAAKLWLLDTKLKLTFSDFSKKYSKDDINVLDLIRYIRILSALKS